MHNLSDKDGKACYYCRRPLEYGTPRKPTKDHVIPQSKEGNDNPDNLVVACWQCNQWKSNKSLGQWLYEVVTWIKRGSRHHIYTKTQLGQIAGNIKKKIAGLKGNINVSDYKM